MIVLVISIPTGEHDKVDLLLMYLTSMIRRHLCLVIRLLRAPSLLEPADSHDRS